MTGCIFLGVDGMDPVVTERMMGEGSLPNFERLAQMGSYGRLATVAPPQSPVVWATIATGKAPSAHGIFDFIHRDPATYKPFLSLHRQHSGKYVNPVQGETFWEQAARRGEQGTLLKWPMGFPPRPFQEGKLLAGLGVPDVRGMLGSYAWYTTEKGTLAPDSKGRIVEVAPRGGKIQTDIAGPFTASLIGRKAATLPLFIEFDEREATLKIGRKAVTLQVGSWSPWIELSFDVGFFRKVTGVCRFLLQQTAPEFRLYLTPVQVDYASAEFPIATPAGYATELSQAIGPYATLGISEDTNALNDGVLSDSEFVELCDAVMAEREAMLMHELARFRNGLLGCVFDTTDRIQHMFWRLQDGSHPMYDAHAAESFGDVIPRYYRWMDRILGEVMERAPGGQLLVCSDHGFTTFRRSVHVNAWLMEKGYLTLKDGVDSCSGLFEGVDWSATSAYAVGFTSIYFNVKGRESQGIVDPADLPALQRRLAADLLTLSDGDVNCVKGCYDTGALYGRIDAADGPDLVIGFADGYRTSWQSAIGAFGAGPVLENNLKKWSGDHCCDASLVPGVIFGSRRESVADVATVLDVARAIGGICQT
ncbi:alkaline phosphatase family protein [Geomonas sp. Red69]|uniref:alkaline phosphatase family protein n=1 Tax=Geomonas diazotrophica TaxID=2843197 RepID=UPI001C1179B7|nr:alkaline phosphatase family protein [Geomonas diazotrophica]MBU5636067.1 alkaline phosphatase family protein [Geomonas diazotrophica]